MVNVPIFERPLTPDNQAGDEIVAERTVEVTLSGQTIFYQQSNKGTLLVSNQAVEDIFAERAVSSNQVTRSTLTYTG